MKIAMLGSGFIARFYATSLHAQRRKDFIYTIYSRNIENAKKFAEDFQLPHFTDDMERAISHPEVDVVIISLPNHLTKRRLQRVLKQKSMCFAQNHWVEQQQRQKE